MLELKLQEHDPYVDRFVITEANKTYNQIDKPYRLESQWARYKKWHHKITYLKFDATGLESGWPTEHTQREWPIKQFNLKSEDLIVMSDLDEFLLPQDWEWIASNINNDQNKLNEIKQRLAIISDKIVEKIIKSGDKIYSDNIKIRLYLLKNRVKPHYIDKRYDMFSLNYIDNTILSIINKIIENKKLI